MPKRPRSVSNEHENYKSIKSYVAKQKDSTYETQQRLRAAKIRHQQQRADLLQIYNEEFS